MKTKLTFLIAALFSLILSNTALAANNNIPAIDVAKLTSGEQTLVIGYMKDFPPFYLPGSGNPPKGMDADIFQEVAKKSGIKNLKYVDFENFAALNEALKSGKIDIIVNDYWDFPKHEKEFLLTIPYYVRDGIAFIFSKDKNFKTVADLRGHKIGVYKEGSDLVTWVKENPIPQATVTMYDDSEDVIDALEDKKIDAAFVYYTLYLYTLSQHPKQHPFNAVLTRPIPSSFALRKQDTALQSTLNQTLETMWADGSLYQLKTKYLKPIGITEPARSYK